jgi:hypothetical protein
MMQAVNRAQEAQAHVRLEQDSAGDMIGHAPATSSHVTG